MFTFDPNMSALLFCASMACTYFGVRRNKGHLASVYVMALIANSICFVAYAVTRHNSLVLAIVNGLFLGMLFTTLTTMVGMLFNAMDVTNQAMESAQPSAVMSKMNHN